MCRVCNIAHFLETSHIDVQAKQEELQEVRSRCETAEAKLEIVALQQSAQASSITQLQVTAKNVTALLQLMFF